MGGRIKNLRFSPHVTCYHTYYTLPSIKVNLHQEVNAVENALRSNYYYRGPSRLFVDPFRVRLTGYGVGGGVSTGNRMKRNTHTAKRSVCALIKIVLGQGQKCIQSSRFTNMVGGGGGVNSALEEILTIVICVILTITRYYYVDYYFLIWPI